MAYDTNLGRFRAVVAAALAHLEARRQEVNDLNVFPVADGDTGDNMALTLRAVLSELDRLVEEQKDRTLDEIGRDEIVDAVARAALLGARGNSGVILSQFIRGAAEELASRPGELVDPTLIGSAMTRSVDRAYDSVRNPAEGTILTVAREMAHRIVSELAHMPAPRLDAEAPDDELQNELIAEVLERALDAGQESVRRTPDLLPVLADAGVVDAGGYALTVIFAGVIAALRGSEAPEIEHHTAPARITHPEHSSETYRYCTNFAVTGTDLEPTRWREELTALGDSILVVGDPHTLKVHVHTDQPESATGLFEGVGEISHLDVADMHAQVAERAERLATNGHAPAEPGQARCGVVAVASGAGMRRLFESLGAHVVDGGQTLNPSTYEILAGIHDVPAEEIVVLPNSSNVIMAAERAAEVSDKTVAVVPTRSQQAGLTAAVAFEPSFAAESVAAAMEEAIVELRIGAVAPAARDDVHGRFVTGDAVGFVEDEIVAWGDPEATLRTVLGSLGRGAELLTCISGEGAPVSDATVEGMAPDGVELEVRQGGQPAYWWLLAAE